MHARSEISWQQARELLAGLERHGGHVAGLCLPILARFAIQVQQKAPAVVSPTDPQAPAGPSSCATGGALLQRVAALVVAQLPTWPCTCLPSALLFLGSCVSGLEQDLQELVWAAAADGLCQHGKSLVQLVSASAAGLPPSAGAGLQAARATSCSGEPPEVAATEVPATQVASALLEHGVADLAAGVGLMVAGSQDEPQRCRWLLACYLASFGDGREGHPLLSPSPPAPTSMAPSPLVGCYAAALQGSTSLGRQLAGAAVEAAQRQQRQGQQQQRQQRQGQQQQGQQKKGQQEQGQHLGQLPAWTRMGVSWAPAGVGPPPRSPCLEGLVSLLLPAVLYDGGVDGEQGVCSDDMLPVTGPGASTSTSAPCQGLMAAVALLLACSMLESLLLMLPPAAGALHSLQDPRGAAWLPQALQPAASALMQAVQAGLALAAGGPRGGAATPPLLRHAAGHCYARLCSSASVSPLLPLLLPPGPAPDAALAAAAAEVLLTLTLPLQHLLFLATAGAPVAVVASWLQSHVGGLLYRDAAALARSVIEQLRREGERVAAGSQRGTTGDQADAGLEGAWGAPDGLGQQVQDGGSAWELPPALAAVRRMAAAEAEAYGAIGAAAKAGWLEALQQQQVPPGEGSGDASSAVSGACSPLHEVLEKLHLCVAGVALAAADVLLPETSVQGQARSIASSLSSSAAAALAAQGAQSASFLLGLLSEVAFCRVPGLQQEEQLVARLSALLAAVPGGAELLLEQLPCYERLVQQPVAALEHTSSSHSSSGEARPQSEAEAHQLLSSSLTIASEGAASPEPMNDGQADGEGQQAQSQTSDKVLLARWQLDGAIVPKLLLLLPAAAAALPAALDLPSSASRLLPYAALLLRHPEEGPCMAAHALVGSCLSALCDAGHSALASRMLPFYVQRALEGPSLMETQRPGSVSAQSSGKAAVPAASSAWSRGIEGLTAGLPLALRGMPPGSTGVRACVECVAEAAASWLGGAGGSGSVGGGEGALGRPVPDFSALYSERGRPQPGDAERLREGIRHAGEGLQTAAVPPGSSSWGSHGARLVSLALSLPLLVDWPLAPAAAEAAARVVGAAGAGPARARVIQHLHDLLLRSDDYARKAPLAAWFQDLLYGAGKLQRLQIL